MVRSLSLSLDKAEQYLYPYTHSRTRTHAHMGAHTHTHCVPLTIVDNDMNMYLLPTLGSETEKVVASLARLGLLWLGGQKLK